MVIHRFRFLTLGVGLSCLSLSALSPGLALAQGQGLTAAVPPVLASIPHSAMPMANNAPTLEGPLWGLTRYRSEAGELVEAETFGDQSPSIQFTEGKMAGNGSCNRFFGSYEVADTQLTLSPGGSTMMACPALVMVQEQAFLAALAEVNRYAITDGELQLYDANDTLLLTFNALVALPLTRTPWELTAYNNGRGGVTSVLADTRITATFQDDDTLTGSAGCNQYRSSYSVTDGVLAIAPGATTRKLCSQPEGIMEQEAAYLAALATATGYRIEENRLTLVTETGATAAQFRVAPEP